jgi:hypothetical protein
MSDAMNADDEHEFRMAIGTASMDITDALAASMDTLMDIRPALAKAFAALTDEGIPPLVAAGMVNGLVFNVLHSMVGE